MTRHPHSESPGALALRKLLRHRTGLTGLIVIVLLFLTALFAPLIAPMDPSAQILEYSLKPTNFVGSVLVKKNPSNPDNPQLVAVSGFRVQKDSVFYVQDGSSVELGVHLSALQGSSQSEWHRQPRYLLGADNFGRDLFSRLVYGAQISLVVGVVSQLIALAIGIILGSLAGFFRGWVDTIIMYGMNVFWSFPTILIAILFSAVLKSTQGLLGFELNAFWQTFIAIGISSWVEIARIVRGQFFSLREMDFVEATRALGFSNVRMIFRHILPNALSPIIVLSSAGIATAIIVEASLSFLGLGIQKPEPSWGILISEGYGFILSGTNYGLTIYPALAISAAVFGFNLLGDGLRDVFDPRAVKKL